MKTSEKVAYIKGLMEGMKLDASKPETRILSEMLDVLTDLATANNSLTEENIKLRDYIEELDYDLGDLESFVYDLDEEDDEDEDDDWGHSWADDDDDEYEYEEESDENDEDK